MTCVVLTTQKYDAIIIATGQAGPPLAKRLSEALPELIQAMSKISSRLPREHETGANPYGPTRFNPARCQSLGTRSRRARPTRVHHAWAAARLRPRPRRRRIGAALP